MQPRVKHPYVGGRDRMLLTWVDIEDVSQPGYVYLRRFVVFKTKWCGLYIHWIYTPDGDRDPHNHPMSFWSFLLRGSYVERRWQQYYDRPAVFSGARWRKRFTFARTTREDFHIIDHVLPDGDRPVATLLLCGWRAQEWGFLVDGGFEHHRDYLAKRHLSV